MIGALIVSFPHHDGHFFTVTYSRIYIIHSYLALVAATTYLAFCPSHIHPGKMSESRTLASGFEARLEQRNGRYRPNNFSNSKGSLEMRPVGPSQPHGNIPNTPGAVSFISFVLGGICFLSLSTFVSKFVSSGVLHEGVVNQAGWWWATPQLGFFLAAWSIFHWAEFAVTAGWNKENCSVDCELPVNCYRTRSF